MITINEDILSLFGSINSVRPCKQWRTLYVTDDHLDSDDGLKMDLFDLSQIQSLILFHKSNKDNSVNKNPTVIKLLDSEKCVNPEKRTIVDICYL